MIRHEIIWSTINVVVSAFTLGTMKAFLSSRGYISYNSEPVSAAIIALEFALYFFGFDAYFYWLHRLMHIDPIYTWVHKTHHFSTSTNPLTSISINPVEALINGSFVPLYAMIATMLASVFGGFSPLHSASVAFIAPTSILMGFYVHSGFELLPSWWNRSWITKWFISATFHDQHHRYFRGNFGGYTTIWDRLCGTMRSNFEKDFAAVTTRPIQGSLGGASPRGAAAEGAGPV
ncbi:MAG TPA: sterol desaturase family protein [Sphingobium sp.]|uniref:sterol desaturase family protein n=1 Tax=Sphingobium sp. TaxID=1912891 RepID=UPI002ED62A0F